MDDGDATGVIDDTNLQRLTVCRGPDEHRDGGITGLKASPMMSECMKHVENTVLAGARLDVHVARLRPERSIVNIC